MNNADSPLHIGGVLSFMEPLCKKFSEDESEIKGWIMTRDQKIPREQICPECFALYEKGLAWKFPSQRE